MSAIETLKSRNNLKVLEQKYIERVLKDESTEINRAQERLISRFNVKKYVPEITQRKFRVVGTRLESTHPIRERFIDMRRTSGVRQRPIPLHNKVIYGHFNNIINKLAYGLTEEIKQTIGQEYNIQL
ncbi:hypothetical protein [Abyssalbus ytuae]|uniref:Uncharacterized protein n=1 Tax=Abyssalbus ytuae TaxID=2926907 RepID=A0A9E7CSN8_9FLAO|nr:hypothetical protein [Abyssalbus ytuae]UOB16571.1 hypothetical protein MQE35_12600 [Abyssalbus ytuae]